LHYVQALVDQAALYELQEVPAAAGNMLILCRCLEAALTEKLGKHDINALLEDNNG
jgi:hypothetical protein